MIKCNFVTQRLNEALALKNVLNILLQLTLSLKKPRSNKSSDMKTIIIICFNPLFWINLKSTVSNYNTTKKFVITIFGNFPFYSKDMFRELISFQFLRSVKGNGKDFWGNQLSVPRKDLCNQAKQDQAWHHRTTPVSKRINK